MRIKHRIQKRLWIAAFLWVGVLACGRLAAASYLSEPFAYPDGPITASAAFWEHTSGMERQLNVQNGVLLLREDHSEDIAANLASGPFAADSGATLYAAFDLTATTLPSGEGTYFAHFRDSGSNFRGRVFIAPTADGQAGFYRIGISSGAGSSEEAAFFPQPLAIGDRYQVALRYEVETAVSTLWVDPTDTDSESIGNNDSASPKTITRFAFRQSLSSGNGMGELQIDNLVVASTLEEALAGPSSQPRPEPEPEPEPEPVAVIQIVAESQTVQEGAEPLMLTWTRTERTEEELRIALVWSGTAQAGSDFAAPPEAVVIESGRESISLSIPLLNDEEIEPDEVFEVSFSVELPHYELETERIVWTIQDDNRQGLLIQESFSGPDAPVVSLPGWATHSGQPEQTHTAGGVLRLNDESTEDVHLEIPGQPFSADGEAELFAAFDLTMRAMASGSGNYFAHFKGRSATAFRGRLYLRPVEDDEEKFQLGVIPGSSGNPSYSTDLLALGQNYRVVLGYQVKSERTRLWLNPLEKTSAPNAESQETTSAIDITSFAFRQTGHSNDGIGELTIDNLAVGANLESVLTSATPPPPEPPLPSISIETLKALAFEEGQRPGQWRISRTGDPSETLKVSFTLSGSAVLSEDFTLSFSPQEFAFAIGESSRVLTLSPLDDDEVEGGETVEISLLPGNGYKAGCPNRAVIQIVDNDAPALNPPPSLAVDREALTASVPFGGVFRLQKSADLKQWETVETIEGDNAPFAFPLENFQEKTLFFRLIEGLDPTFASVPCAEDNRVLNVGFYAFFSPISHSETPDAPDCSGFNQHLGYEADLLTALEALDGAGLSFSRKAIPDWDGIWLRSATPEYDLIGGGITILESRTLDASGQPIVAFTSGHVAFRQSLLVRAEDASHLANYDSLNSDVRVGALRGTTGEFRLLQLTGLVNDEGTLASGTRVETPNGEVTADGSPAYQITAAQATDNLSERSRLRPPSATMPQVIYLGSETELLQALRDGQIDALARGEIGNQDAAHLSKGDFVVSAVDLQATEYGGFTLAAEDTALLACLNEKINWLTRNGEIGYAQWRKDPKVFLNRAALWNRLRASTP